MVSFVANFLERFAAHKIVSHPVNPYNGGIAHVPMPPTPSGGGFTLSGFGTRAVMPMFQRSGPPPGSIDFNPPGAGTLVESANKGVATTAANAFRNLFVKGDNKTESLT